MTPQDTTISPRFPSMMTRFLTFRWPLKRLKVPLKSAINLLKKKVKPA